MSREDFAPRARKVSQAKGFRFDMGQAVESGYRLIGKGVLGGKVLTDAENPALDR